MTFRADVQALRAWAVWCVVAYHWKVPGFEAGLLGVDVFFVLSGYLMTTIIQRGLTEDRFHYGHFMLARVRRIVPGLVVLVALALLLGSRLSPPHAYAELGRHALASLGFFSNLSFLSGADYFAGPSDYKWLMHTWSLSVEWQFYMVWPVALWLLHKLGWRGGRWLAAVGLIAAVSLGACVYLTPDHPGVAFYTLPTRTWELLCGALVAGWQPLNPTTSARFRAWAAWSGWALLLVQPWALAGLSWPGAWAALPCLATMLVLWGHADQARIVHAAAIQAVGRWSYSIHLIHWPLHVVWLSLGWTEHPALVALGLAASVALGAVGYQVVETPGRRWVPSSFQGGQWRRAQTLAPAAGLTLVAVLSALTTWQQGWPGRFDARVGDLEGSVSWYTVYSTDCLTFTKSPLALSRCSNRADPEPVGLYIWGDSHGDAILNVINQVAQVRTEFSGHAGCAPVPGELSRSARCTAFANMAQAYFEAAPVGVPLLIVGRFSDYIAPKDKPSNPVSVWVRRIAHPDQADASTAFLDAMQRSMCTLANRRPVYVLRPLPEMQANVPIAATLAEMLGGGFGDDTLAEPVAAVRARHQAVNTRLDQIARDCGIHLIDATPALCPGGWCRAASSGQPMYIDHDHLSTVGSAKLMPLLSARLPGAPAVAAVTADAQE